MGNRFVCRQTGMCCSHIRGFIGDDEKAFFQEYAYGKLPLVQLIPIERTSFPLWDWEAKRFLDRAEKLGMDARIIPSRAVFDQKENKTIIFTYSIDADSCTFLKDGKCVIYNERAFICRLFPFQKSPFLKTKQQFDVASMFGCCPSVSGIIPNIPSKLPEMVAFLHENFGSTFLAAVENDFITEWANGMIIRMMRENLIVPAMNLPYSILLEKIRESEKINLTEYLVRKGIYSSQGMENVISDFEDNAHAKSRVKGVVHDINRTDEKA